MNETNWEEMGFGPYPVTEISHFMLPLSDCVSLALKVWLPCRLDMLESNFPQFLSSKQWAKEICIGKSIPKTEETFPSILEYLPYSKDSHYTLQRDHSRHSWFSSHGYVDVRVDMRGTGASEGFYFEEYGEQEIDDAIEIINWFSNQKWSNGKVGMYGKSWGGFNSLQVAYKKPKGLCTAISLYSTDNRFTDDIHYQGDLIVGDGTLSWSTVMFLLNARPAHPRYFQSISKWKKSWGNRLQMSSHSWLPEWLSHQHRNDAYWKHGSICISPEIIECPFLVIGGHTDGYTNAAFRMSAKLNKSSRTIVGPWDHQWPDVSVVGPNIDFLNVCLQWWNYHLKDIKTNNVLSWPRLSLFIRDSHRPDDLCGLTTGQFISLDDYDKRYELFQGLSASSFIDEQLFQVLYLTPDMKLLFENVGISTQSLPLIPHALQGAGIGSWFSIDEGFPEDQNIANDNSQCWVSSKLTSDFTFAGLAKAFICVEAEKAGKYGLYVRVCDQLPGGESTLVSKGCQNLATSDDGWGSVFPKGLKRIISIQLNATGYKIKAGHRLLVSITPTCFPAMYPTADSLGLQIYPGESKIAFQTVTIEGLSKTVAYSLPKPLLQLHVSEKTEGSFCTSKCNSQGKYLFEVSEKSGLLSFPSLGYEVEENSIERYRTDEKVTYGRMTATKSIMSSFELSDNEKVKTFVEVFQELNGGRNHFTIKSKLTVLIEDEIFFEKTWDNVISRKYV